MTRKVAIVATAALYDDGLDGHERNGVHGIEEIASSNLYRARPLRERA